MEKMNLKERIEVAQKNEGGVMTFEERCLIQLTKAYRLLDSEGYNHKTIYPIYQLTQELREKLNVLRVKTDTKEEIIYSVAQKNMEG